MKPAKRKAKRRVVRGCELTVTNGRVTLGNICQRVDRRWDAYTPARLKLGPFPTMQEASAALDGAQPAAVNLEAGGHVAPRAQR